ncbi:MAG: prolyl hydroxylase family protein [Sphingobium sp.]
MGKKVAAKLARNPMITCMGNDAMRFYMRDYFASPHECAELRAMIDEGARPSPLFSGTAGAEYRTSSTCTMPPTDMLVDAITMRIAALLGMEASHGETLQGQRYRPGQEYRLHCDYFPGTASYWPHMRAQGGQRCWTAMIYLNTVEAGGETSFPHAGLAIPPMEGRLLVWNNMREDGSPNPESLHAAQPVEAGTKYVLTHWFRERPWGAASRT